MSSYHLRNLRDLPTMRHIMDDDVIKLLCPHCSGKLAMDSAYHKDLVGQNINCPHCDRQIKVPSTVKKIRDDERPSGGYVARRSTQKIEKPAGWHPASLHAAGQDSPVFCPKCKEEVGSGDRICISCGTRLAPRDRSPAI